MTQKEAQINVKLSQDRLDEWDSYIQDETGFASRAEFVRFAVQREIKGEHKSDTGQNQIDSNQLSQVVDSLETLSNQFEGMNERMDTLENAVSQDPHIEEIADTIFSLLPEHKPGTPEWEQKDQDLQQEYQYTEAQEAKQRHIAHKGTPESLSEALDEPIRKVHVALDKLITETHLIRSEESDDEQTRYWKEV